MRSLIKRLLAPIILEVIAEQKEKQDQATLEMIKEALTKAVQYVPPTFPG